ncbi:DUF7312 domain-containing protein [Halobellus rufus]|uniref:DUF7312 domain-containing protein n=1 Tax=Halobellus rufus TaxID=1448860 RepID=UPI00067871C0|nr:hypothetical protein [Halobellus rufus]
MTERDDPSGTVVEADDASDDASNPGRGEQIPRPRIAGEARTTREDSAADEGEAEFFRPPIEPESPGAENALFVVIGVVGTILLFVSAVAPGLI